ncbi:MAG: discoidin domain-containing protein, partial [bacterium]|nr:discoidin domain-containing protein [bacterium]
KQQLYSFEDEGNKHYVGLDEIEVVDGFNTIRPVDVTTYSSFHRGYKAIQAVDGNLASGWASRGSTDERPEYLVVDFGREISFDKIRLFSRKMTTKDFYYFPLRFRFEVRSTLPSNGDWDSEEGWTELACMDDPDTYVNEGHDWWKKPYWNSMGQKNAVDLPKPKEIKRAKFKGGQPIHGYWWNTSLTLPEREEANGQHWQNDSRLNSDITEAVAFIKMHGYRYEELYREDWLMLYVDNREPTFVVEVYDLQEENIAGSVLLKETDYRTGEADPLEVVVKVTVKYGNPDLTPMIVSPMRSLRWEETNPHIDNLDGTGTPGWIYRLANQLSLPDSRKVPLSTSVVNPDGSLDVSYRFTGSYSIWGTADDGAVHAVFQAEDNAGNVSDMVDTKDNRRPELGPTGPVFTITERPKFQFWNVRNSGDLSGDLLASYDYGLSQDEIEWSVSSGATYGNLDPSKPLPTQAFKAVSGVSGSGEIFLWAHPNRQLFPFSRNDTNNEWPKVEVTFGFDQETKTGVESAIYQLNEVLVDHGTLNSSPNADGSNAFLPDLAPKFTYGLPISIEGRPSGIARLVVKGFVRWQDVHGILDELRDAGELDDYNRDRLKDSIANDTLIGGEDEYHLEEHLRTTVGFFYVDNEAPEFALKISQDETEQGIVGLKNATYSGLDPSRVYKE